MAPYDLWAYRGTTILTCMYENLRQKCFSRVRLRFDNHSRLSVFMSAMGNGAFRFCCILSLAVQQISDFGVEAEWSGEGHTKFSRLRISIMILLLALIVSKVCAILCHC